MKKKSLVYILAMILILPLAGCTSSESAPDGDAAQQAANDSQFSQEGEGDFAKTQEGDPQSQVQPDGQTGQGQVQQNALADAGTPPQDAGQDLALDGQQQQPAGGTQDELSLDDPQPLPDGVAGAENPAAAAGGESPPPAEPAPAPADTADAAPPPTDEPLFKDDASAAPMGDVASSAPSEEHSSPAPKTFAPLQKVKGAPFEKDGTTLNRYYVARSDDKSFKAISKKIYGGKDRSQELKAWNPWVARRAPKVGDKIYYQSETNPSDTQMMSFYEEAGIQPLIYTTQDGDNIRKLSKEWLGTKDSWKEVWETNPDVDSKGDLPSGLQLKYWPSDVSASVAHRQAPSGEAGGPAPDFASAPPPPPPDAPPPPDFSPPSMADSMAPPPPGDMPPGPSPASTPDMAAGGVAPPPPPDQQVPPPPPPPPPPEPKKPMKPVAAGEGESDPDTTMAMGLGAILLIAAAVLFVVLRKNRAKRVDLSQTQV